MGNQLRDRTVLPPAETENLNGLVRALREGGRAALVGPDGEHWELPWPAFEALRDVVEAMSGGYAITVMPRHTMLTTQEAADMLGISRPTLVRLVEAGEIPHERRGRHRKLRLPDVLDYQRRAHVEREKILDEMVAGAADAGLYDDTAAASPTR